MFWSDMKQLNFPMGPIKTASLFDMKSKEDSRCRSIYDFIMLAVGYGFYVLPVGIIGYLFLFPYSAAFVCYEMAAPFLLDNNVQPAVNMAELYERKRNEYDEWARDEDWIRIKWKIYL